MAQYQLTISVTDVPSSHCHEPIYVTGNFNAWQVDDSDMQLTRQPDGTYAITINYTHIPSDRIEFKFTRGSWATLESNAAGRLMGPHLAELNKNTTVYCSIKGWRDDYPASTASKNVHLLSEAFYMPQLNRSRKIWIYLPKDYASSTKSYPVIYMHDGQGLFDEATSKGRLGPIEWGVDESIDQSDFPAIVVGINHHDSYAVRREEFFYRPSQEFPEPQGSAYIAFIVETLKPYIDTHYRTIADKAHTGIAGSSLGGLLSLYAGLNYPQTFGYIGVFSPSIWRDSDNINREIKTVNQSTEISQQHYYFYAGGNENREKKDGSFVQMTKDVQRIIKLLDDELSVKSTYSTNPHGRHGQLYWGKAFPDFYAWFVKNQCNKVKP